MSRPPSRILAGSLLPLVVLAFAVGCKKSPPANVAATVNGRAITFEEVEKRYIGQFGAAEGDKPSDDQVSIQKLEVLRTLIDDEIMLQRAEKLGLMATDSDVETRFNELKAPYTQEEFQRLLTERKMNVDDVKAQLRRELSIKKLFNKEITSHISISDKDVAEFYNANKDGFNWPEPQIHLAQILVTPQADPQVRNLKNDKAQNEEQARKKMQMIESRLKQGEDFAMIAQNYSEDPQSAPNGGDLGFIPESAMEKANVELRRIVMNLQPGQFAQIRTPEGYRILKVISREPAGLRELNDPRVQQTIRETLLNRKDQLLKAAYYETSRNEADIANHLAQSIIGKRDQKGN